MESFPLSSAPSSADDNAALGSADDPLGPSSTEEPFQLSDSWSLISSKDRERKYYASVELNSADDQPSDEDREAEHMAGQNESHAHDRVRFGPEDMESEPGDHDVEVDPSPVQDAAGMESSASRTADSLLSPIPMLVTHSLFSASFAGDVKLPWEKSPIFAEDPVAPALKFSNPLSQGSKPSKPEVKIVASCVPYAASTAVFARAITGQRDEDFRAERESILKKAVHTWAEICSAVGSMCEPGELIDTAVGPQSMMAVEQCVRDCVGVRSPFTVRKRAYALQGFRRWVELAEDFGPASFELSTVTGYVSFLKETKASGYTAASFMSALRFARHVLGFKIDNILTSRRLAGLSEQMLASKDVYDPPPPLQVEQVLQLHELLRSEGMHPYDQAAVARILFALYGRCRRSDLQLIKRIEVDCDGSSGFVTFFTGHHKAGKAAKQKALLLPILVPAESVDGRPVGMTLTGELDGPLLRAAASATSSALRSRAITSSELSAARVLEAAVEAESG